ncbi:hypothetical protein BDQ17DRAFT_306484 [Cyathus striatus]|nr:hypothetical protein BDQ17DRAFT_306484 [Cyathus striatus]
MHRALCGSQVSDGKGHRQVETMLNISTPADALSIYFTFVKANRIEDAMKVAHSDTILFTPPASLYVYDMEEVSAAFYYRLLQYRNGYLLTMNTASEKYGTGSHFNDLQWRTTLKTMYDGSLYYAAPIVEKHIRMIKRETVSNARSSKSRMKQLLEESTRLKNELQVGLSSHNIIFKSTLVSCVSVETFGRRLDSTDYVSNRA